MQKKSLVLIFIVLSLVLIYIIFNSNKNLKKEIKILEDVSMIIEEDSLTNTSAKIIITDLNKKEKHIYSENYNIEKKEDNQWKELKLLTDNASSTPREYFPDSNGMLEFHIYWGNFYGELQPGKYRIVKYASINNSVNDKGIVYAEFTIK